MNIHIQEDNWRCKEKEKVTGGLEKNIYFDFEMLGVRG